MAGATGSSRGARQRRSADGQQADLARWRTPIRSRFVFGHARNSLLHQYATFIRTPFMGRVRPPT